MAGESEGGGWFDEAWETVRQWVEKVWEWGVDLVKALVNTLYDMLFDVFLRIVDAVLTVVVGVIVFALFTPLLKLMEKFS